MSEVKVSIKAIHSKPINKIHTDSDFYLLPTTILETITSTSYDTQREAHPQQFAAATTVGGNSLASRPPRNPARTLQQFPNDKLNSNSLREHTSSSNSSISSRVTVTPIAKVQPMRTFCEVSNKVARSHSLTIKQTPSIDIIQIPQTRTLFTEEPAPIQQSNNGKLVISINPRQRRSVSQGERQRNTSQQAPPQTA